MLDPAVGDGELLLAITDALRTDGYQDIEIYGFDILLDTKLKPHLLEINISPSLSSSSPLDKKIKTTLLCDTLNLIGVTPYDRKTHDKELENIMKKRLLGLDKQTTAYKMQ